MKSIFSDWAAVEKKAVEKFLIAPLLMMENAASSLEQVIFSEVEKSDYKFIIIACGKGNNGADGVALARRIYGKIPVFVFCPEPLKTEEGVQQFKIAEAIGVPFISENKFMELLNSKSKKIIVDCFFGTGFRGELSEPYNKFISNMNDSAGLKIACDIPSGLKFKADITVTFGSYKTAHFLDTAKDFCGRLECFPIGFDCEKFFEVATPDAYLVESSDVKLPVRKTKNTHKGKFGHTCFVAGEKSGAAILASCAALNFGSGLVSILKTDFSNLQQFKISPMIMVEKEFPKNTTAVLLGSGLGILDDENKFMELSHKFMDYFNSSKNPACVLDADVFYQKKFPEFLKSLNENKNARIVLTPHAKELFTIVKKLDLNFENAEKIFEPSDALKYRIEIGKAFTKKFDNCVLIMKGANTFVASGEKIFVIDVGVPSLAKGGSGDVLAGMVSSLLAQGYSAEDAALTAVWAHGFAAKKYGENSYSLTAEKLIEMIGEF